MPLKKFKNGFFQERGTKHPQPWGHPIFLKASPSLKFIWQSSHLKHVFRAGLLKRNVPPEKCETTADHTAAGFLTIFMVMGDEHDVLFRLLVYEQWAIHDNPESGPFGDIPPEEVFPWEKTWMEEAWFMMVGKDVPEWDRLIARFTGYNEGKTPAAKVDKHVDKEDAISYSVPLSWRFSKVVPERFIERRAGFFTLQPFADIYEEIKRIVAENPPRRMHKSTWERLAGPAKHPRPCDLPFFGKASARLQWIWQAQHVKHVYNPEFLDRGIPREKCETVGDHIAGGLNLIVLLFGDRYEPRKRLRIYELWAAAHLDEVLLRDVGPRLPDWGRIEALVAEWKEGKTEEAQIVRQLGPLESALYAVTLGWHYPEFDPWPFMDKAEGVLTFPPFVELHREAKALLAETRPRSV